MSEDFKENPRPEGGQKNIKRQNNAFVYILLLLGVLIVGAASYYLMRNEMMVNMNETGSYIAAAYASEEKNNLTTYATLIDYATENIDRQLESGYSDERMKIWIKMYFDRVLTVLGEENVAPFVVYNDEVFSLTGEEAPVYEELGLTLEDAPWYVHAGDDSAVYFSDVHYDEIHKRDVITASNKCPKSGNIVAFDIFVENFQLDTRKFAMPEKTSYFLMDNSGNTIYYQTSMDPRNTDSEVRAYAKDVFDKIKSGELKEYTSSVIDLDGVERGVYYYRMNNGWISFVTMPFDTVLSGLTRFSGIFFLVLTICLVVLALAFIMNNKVTRRMRIIDNTMQILSNSYYALVRVNFEKETYELIKASAYMQSCLAPVGDYTDFIKEASRVMEDDTKRSFRDSFSAVNIRTLVEDEVVDYGGDFRRVDGKGDPLWVTIRLLYNEMLSRDEVLLCFRVSEAEKQKELQEKKLLEDALNSSKRSEKSKLSFFNNMSHDMRTPLNAITSMSKLAQEHLNEPKKLRDYLEKINFSGQTLLDLVNDILDMSKMENGQLPLESQKFELTAYIDERIASFRTQAEQEGKNFKVSYKVKNNLVSTDSFRLGQILNNLLSNAFKFTSYDDTITLSVEQLDEKKISQFRIIVSDTGIGMSEEFLPKLFEPYAREKQFTPKRISGTGLGMPILKNLVTQFNGQIDVKSELGKGTTFTLIIPMNTLSVAEDTPAAPKPDDSAFKPAFSLKGMRILVAEDNELNMEVAEEILRMNGAVVVKAWNGAEAVERFSQAPEFSFDAVLMDMQMPVMDGCTASRKIRALDRADAKRVPIIAVTANAFAEDISATGAAGMSAHIAKPIDFDVLCTTLDRLISEQSRDK